MLGSPGYEIRPWHQTLLAIAIVAFCAFFNIFLAARLPITEAIVNRPVEIETEAVQTLERVS